MRFYIWEERGAMYSALPDVLPPYWGYTQQNRWAERKDRCIVSLPKRFGEIHLCKGHYGTGVVAHELMHLLNYWVSARGMNWERHDEKIAKLMGKLSSLFWIEHYERIEHGLHL